MVLTIRCFKWYTTEAEGGLYGHKTIMTKGVDGWTILCLLDYDVS